MFKYFLLATFSANLASTTVVANTDLKQLLQRHENKWSPRTEILFPSDVGWKNETERWNIYSGPSYRASIKPGSEADVQKIVKYRNLASEGAISVSLTHVIQGKTC